MIYKTIELQKEYEEYMTKHEPQNIQKKIITMFKEDFCDKYLEIQKQQETENGNKVTLWCLASIIKLLHPFIPFISQEIRDMIGFE
ncbi:MAG: class I tRNA ligase family protein [bacterium]